MVYQRKTIDTWEIWTDYGYGHGWEHETTELSYVDMEVNRKAYLENANCNIKIIKKRQKWDIWVKQP